MIRQQESKFSHARAGNVAGIELMASSMLSQYCWALMERRFSRSPHSGRIKCVIPLVACSLLWPRSWSCCAKPVFSAQPNPRQTLRSLRRCWEREAWTVGRLHQQSIPPTTNRRSSRRPPRHRSRASRASRRLPNTLSHFASSRPRAAPPIFRFKWVLPRGRTKHNRR